MTMIGVYADWDDCMAPDGLDPCIAAGPVHENYLNFSTIHRRWPTLS
jgi:hypothetical protein